jgi:hypothetical protein
MMVTAIIELLDDINFQIWIRSPNMLINEYWENVLRDNPERRDSIDKARTILQAIDKDFISDFPDDEDVEKMLRKIRYEINRMH